MFLAISNNQLQNFKKDTIILYGKSLKMKCDFLVYNTIFLKICVLLESPLSFI